MSAFLGRKTSAISTTSTIMDIKPMRYRTLGYDHAIRRVTRPFSTPRTSISPIKAMRGNISRCYSSRPSQRPIGWEWAGFDDVWKQIGKVVVPSIAGLCVSLSFNLPSHASVIIRLPGSSSPEVFEVQKSMVETWQIVRENFVDGSFNGHKWENELKDALERTIEDGDDVKAAYGEIDAMLGSLGDPYTKFVQPKEFENFRVKTDGELQGVGLLIASEPVSGRLLVLSPVDGSPAAKAGILPGDEVLQINGKPARGLNGEQAAEYLRGRHGTSVTVKLARRTEQIPGVPGKPEYRGKPANIQLRQVRLVRDNINLKSVYSEVIPENNDKIGYIRLTGFNHKAADEMREAILSLKYSGANKYILDLRDNPGGLVDAGLKIAGMWLKPNSVLLHTVTRDGIGQTVSVSSESKPLTEDPLCVLVNKNSASASEILAGALHDNGRAMLLGQQTYGKGKIQSVYELGNGSALFVTVAKYQTPSGQNIDNTGIGPDKMCGAPLLQASLNPLTADIQQDPCVLEAEQTFEGRMQA